jgi:hypothetical protein
LEHLQINQVFAHYVHKIVKYVKVKPFVKVARPDII